MQPQPDASGPSLLEGHIPASWAAVDARASTTLGDAERLAALLATLTALRHAIGAHRAPHRRRPPSICHTCDDIREGWATSARGLRSPRLWRVRRSGFAVLASHGRDRLRRGASRGLREGRGAFTAAVVARLHDTRPERGCPVAAARHHSERVNLEDELRKAPARRFPRPSGAHCLDRRRLLRTRGCRRRGSIAFPRFRG